MASPTYLRMTKSETRELGDQERATTVGRPEDWQMSNGTFFTAFVVIAALVTLAALLLR